MFGVSHLGNKVVYSTHKHTVLLIPGVSHLGNKVVYSLPAPVFTVSSVYHTLEMR